MEGRKGDEGEGGREGTLERALESPRFFSPLDFLKRALMIHRCSPPHPDRSKWIFES